MLAAVTAGLNLGTVGVELMTARVAWNKCNILENERAETKVTASASISEVSEEPDGDEVVPPAQEKSSLTLYFSSDACLGEA